MVKRRKEKYKSQKGKEIVSITGKNILPNPLKLESAWQDWGRDSISGLWILFPSPLLFKLEWPMF